MPVRHRIEDALGQEGREELDLLLVADRQKVKDLLELKHRWHGAKTPARPPGPLWPSRLAKNRTFS
jgi:hypothetical protein